MTNDALPERWTTRDLPVLRETARMLDATHQLLQPHQIAPDVGLGSDDVTASLVWLVNAHYLEGQVSGGYNNEPHAVLIRDVTERGLRTVGLWPSEERIVDALVETLHQAEADIDDPAERTKLQHAIAAVSDVSKAVMTGVLTAYIERHVGM